MLGKRDSKKLAAIISRLWMLRRPCETDTGDIATEICNLIGEDLRAEAIRCIQDTDPDFPTSGL